MPFGLNAASITSHGIAVMAAITDLVPPCTGKKKKRSFFFDESPAFTEEEIDPSFLPKDEEENFNLDSGVADVREGKFLNPWMTITTTNTRTTYTATSTIATVVCTPDGWSIRMCNLSG